MRNSVRVLALFLLVCGVMVTAAAAHDPKVGGEQIFRGCMSGTDDNYVLRAEDGTLYRLHSDKDLDEHVGHAVQVKGTIENKRREREAQASAAASQAAGIAVPQQGINVNDIKTVAAACTPATMGGHSATSGSGAHHGATKAEMDAALEAQRVSDTEQYPGTGQSRVGIPSAGGMGGSNAQGGKQTAGSMNSGATTTTAAGNTSAYGSTAPASGTGANVRTMSGGEHWLEGCLVGTDDYYVMRDTKGTLYRLHSDKDLDEHVGHMVQVKGKVEQNRREIEAQRVTEAARVANVELPTVGINVNDIKTTANTCR